jgi:DNA processing protein
LTNDLLYQLALTKVPHIGHVHAKLLAEELGSAEAIFKAKKSTLEKMEGIGEVRARSIKQFQAFAEQEEEIKFIDTYKIKPLFLTDPDYPKRLLHCYDPPTLLFYRGNANLNSSKIISMIGTRSHSDYGKMMTEKILETLSPHQPLVISGLAYGIDAVAHKAAVKLQLPTVAVLAHGLDAIYPSQHRLLAKQMIEQGGGLLTEFRQATKPDRHNFPTRNRIVAGICDATIVIETGIKGGSIITANLAYSYNRDVFAVPGKTTDSKSEGCNYLIQSNKAVLIRNGEDIIEQMGWEENKKKRTIQSQLFVDLDENEQLILQLLQQKETMHIDELNISSNINSSMVAAAILQLELKNVVDSLPGKRYKLK